MSSNVEGETLDWTNKVDPVHYHGTDQFRVVPGGDWVLAGHPLSQGSYSFQEAGWTYQEHPAHGEAWTILVLGDRRGSLATLKRKSDENGLIETVYGQPVYTGGDYPHPAGPKGIAAVSTTQGPCERGYIFGRIEDLKSLKPAAPALTGLLGDETTGPVIHVLKAESQSVAIPSCTYETELFLAVTKGASRIGEVDYQRGDLRLQKAGTTLPEVTAGADGFEGILVVADRRASPVFDVADAAPPWIQNVAQARQDLSPVTGGSGAPA